MTHIVSLDPSSGVESFWTFHLCNDPFCSDPTEVPALLRRGSLPGPVTVYRLSERQVLGGSCRLRSVLPRYRSARPPPGRLPLANGRPKQTPLPPAATQPANKERTGNTWRRGQLARGPPQERRKGLQEELGWWVGARGLIAFLLAPRQLPRPSR